jgi:hypothetical protein
MLRSTRAITLVLVGSATALLGYQAVAPSHQESGGADFADQADDFNNSQYPTTGPSSGGHGSGYLGSHSRPYHSNYWLFNSGRSFDDGFHSSSSSRGTSGTHGSSGTSRGGFGHSGHAAGS